MRIAQVVHNFTADQPGGTERWTLNLSRELATRHEVRVFTTAVEEGPVRLESREIHGLPVTVCVRPRVGAALGRLEVQRDVTRAYRRFLAEARFDVVHVQHVLDASVKMLGATADSGVPFVVQLHDFWYVCARIDLVRKDLSLCESGPRGGLACVRHCSPVGEFLEYALDPGARRRRSLRDLLYVYRVAGNRRQLARVPGFVVSTDFLRDTWARFGLDPSRVDVISLGLPPAPPGPARAPASRPVRFVALGRLGLRKGTDLLLRAFRDVAPDRATLALLGTLPPQERTVLDPLLASAGPNVRHAGDYELEAAFAGADVLVVPSRQLETFSLVTHEAFQRGVPVVAARRGALAEKVVDGVNGLTFEGQGELRAALERLIEEPALVDRLGAGAPPVPTVAGQAPRFEALYRRVAAS